MATNNLIFSRSVSDSFLTPGELMARAPAAFSLSHAENLSGRYGQVMTTDAMQILEGYGWRPVQAAQKRARKLAGRAYVEHMIAFSNPALKGDGNERPEIILYNSHNGTSSLRLFAGFYRFICSNGIVAGDGFEARLRHTSGSVQGFEKMLSDTVAMVPHLTDRIQQLKGVTFTDAQAYQLARMAASIRWPYLANGFALDESRRGAFATGQTVWDLLRAKRFDDHGLSAYNVLNRIQEGLIRGGAMIQSFNGRDLEGKPRAAKAVGSVSENIRINRELWDLVAFEAGIDSDLAMA